MDSIGYAVSASTSLLRCSMSGVIAHLVTGLWPYNLALPPSLSVPGFPGGYKWLLYDLGLLY